MPRPLAVWRSVVQVTLMISPLRFRPIFCFCCRHAGQPRLGLVAVLAADGPHRRGQG